MLISISLHKIATFQRSKQKISLCTVLRHTKTYILVANTVVNALCRAYVISTVQESLLEDDDNIVSMPYVGLIPFLQNFKSTEKEVILCFNALYRAYTISTLSLWKP